MIQETTTHADGISYAHEYRYENGRMVQQTITRSDGAKKVIEYRYKDGKVTRQTITHADGTKETRSMTEEPPAKNHSPIDWLFDKKAPSLLEWVLSQQSPLEEDWSFRRQAPPLDRIYTSDELEEISSGKGSYIDISIDVQ